RESVVARRREACVAENAPRGAATADLAEQNVPQKPTRDLGSRSRVERRRQRSGSHVPPVSPRFTLDQNDSPAVPPSPWSASRAGAAGGGGGSALDPAGGSRAPATRGSRFSRCFVRSRSPPPPPPPRPPRPQPPPVA